MIEQIANYPVQHFAQTAEEPRLIANSKATGGTLLGEIKHRLADCAAFDFCVAFVADGGLQVLVDSFNELEKHGVRGRLLTSTYLSFNSPDAFRKLLEYDNIEVRVFQGNLHAKGYVFDEGNTSTVIVGSSNMTQMALTCNREWNVLYRTFGESALLNDLKSEFERLWNDRSTVKLSSEWICEYERARKESPSVSVRRETYTDEATAAVSKDEIKPNKMQKLALEALATIHRRNEPRALLVSATGTGKTYLSAFDILERSP